MCSRALRLQVAMPAYVIPLGSKRGLPRTANEARFHVEYCIALAACGADVIVPQHSVDSDAYLRRPEVRAMMANIEVVSDPELTHYHQCRVTVSNDSADLHHARSDGPRGSPQNPLGDADVITKFQRLASHRMSAEASAAYAARFVQLEQEPDCSWLFDELCAMCAWPRNPAPGRVDVRSRCERLRPSTAMKSAIAARLRAARAAPYSGEW